MSYEKPTWKNNPWCSWSRSYILIPSLWRQAQYFCLRLMSFIVSFYKDINTLFLLGSKILYISIRGFGNLGMSFLKKLIETDEIGMTFS